MSEKKEDLRIRRTHKLLCEAMFSLLETQSFDEISVVNICDKAMVHRATFYKHFKDKYEFMEYVTKVKLRDFYAQSKKLADFSDKEKLYRAMIDNILIFIEENKRMLQIAAASSNNNFFDSLHRIIYEELHSFLTSSQKNGETYRAPVDIFAKFLTGGFMSLVRWWLEDDNTYTREEMAKHIECMLISGGKEISE
ncbi:MAG: TetR/AcrR family transcriptional regulator C-terminal domain-containing protein [Clostridia bacterium]|nr:TetR/AcrR family transcriptional regulator C-terminal domain-containing protein [Clostridia bacterium]